MNPHTRAPSSSQRLPIAAKPNQYFNTHRKCWVLTLSANVCWSLQFCFPRWEKKNCSPPFPALRRTLNGCIVFHLHAVVLHKLNRGSGAGKHLNVATSEAQRSVRALVIGKEREHKWNPLIWPLTDSSHSSTCGGFKRGVLRPRGLGPRAPQ